MSAQPRHLFTLTDLAAQLADVQEQAASWQQREEEIKDQIRNHPDIHGPDKYAAGNLTLVVASNRRFDPKRAAEVIPAELLPLVSRAEQVIDKERVKVLVPNAYEDCFTSYQDRVSIKATQA